MLGYKRQVYKMFLCPIAGRPIVNYPPWVLSGSEGPSIISSKWCDLLVVNTEMCGKGKGLDLL